MLVETEGSSRLWLRGMRWDLLIIIFSGIIAFVPYAAYLLLGGNFGERADDANTLGYSARVSVNTIVLMLIGGPHMYATFTRTLMEPEVFHRRKWLYIFTSIAIPLSVILMTIYSYESYVWLLTIFFSLASFHALQQIIWVVGAYNFKAKITTKFWEKFVDYGLVLSSLYPIPVVHIVNGSLLIGPVSLKYNDYLEGWYWVSWLVTGFFLAMLAAFIYKSVKEIREGRLHIAKTLLIIISVLVMGGMPLLPNLDTAFQGINVWHSFQYLGLTWLAHVVIEKKRGKEVGFLHFWRNLYQKSKDASSSIPEFFRNISAEFSGAMMKIDNGSGWSSFYLVTIMMLPVSGMLIIMGQFFLPDIHSGMPGADEAYSYMGILSILLVHYVHDALLFNDHEDLVLEENA